jgi:Sec-independent protein secretion pathway component TatC
MLLLLILIAAAIITPSTDPFQSSHWLRFLYMPFMRPSIVIASRINKAKAQEQDEWS